MKFLHYGLYNIPYYTCTWTPQTTPGLIGQSVYTFVYHPKVLPERLDLDQKCLTWTASPFVFSDPKRKRVVSNSKRCSVRSTARSPERSVPANRPGSTAHLDRRGPRGRRAISGGHRVHAVCDATWQRCHLHGGKVQTTTAAAAAALTTFKTVFKHVKQA